MAEIDSKLIYEVLKSIQARQTAVEEHLAEMKVSMHAMRSHHIAQNTQSSAIQTDIANMYKTLELLDGRLARIERRLDIIDEPAE